MITAIEIKNVNAIDFCHVDFQKNKYKYLEHMIYKDKLVNPIAFYGTNGSGKSSFIEAISQLLVLFLNEPKHFNPFIPNQLNTQHRVEEFSGGEGAMETHKIREALQEISSYVKIFFEIRGKEFEYELETKLPGWIGCEYLKQGERLVFEREPECYRYLDKEIPIKKSLYPTIRRLATEASDDADLRDSFEFLSNIAYVDAQNQNYLFKENTERDYMEIIEEHSKEVKKILAEYKEFPLYDVCSNLTKEGEKNYYALIDAGEEQIMLPYAYISNGMKNQSFLLSVLLSVPENGVLLVDEIEDALHPLTVLDFIHAVQKKNVQLIFSSHNTFILQHLRPDQILFANWKNGYSTYKKLSDIYPNIREVNNIEKMYLAELFDEDIHNG